MRIAKTSVLGLAIFFLSVAAVRSQEGSSENSGEYRIVKVEGLGGPPTAARRRAVRDKKTSPETVEGSIRIQFTKPTDLSELRQAVVVLPVAILDWRKAVQEEDQIVRIPGSFQIGIPYNLVLTHPVNDREGKFAISTGRYPFTIPPEKAQIRFLGQGSVLERESRQLIHLALKSVERVRLEATQVPIHALVPRPAQPKNVSPPAETRGKPSTGSKNTSVAEPSLSDELPTEGSIDSLVQEWNRRTNELKAVASSADSPFAGLFDAVTRTESEPFFEPGPEGKERRCSLPLSWRETAKLGATFLVRARSLDDRNKGKEEEETLSSIKSLQITDLALSHKFSKTELVVWVTSLNSAQVVPEARVFLTTKDGKLLAAGRTDADGILKLAAGNPLASLDLASRGTPAGQTQLDLATVHRIIVVTGKDLAWSNLEDNLVKIPKKIRSGVASEAELTRAHVFTERGIYRPKDKVRYKVTVRQFKTGSGLAPEVGSANGSCRILAKDAKGQTVQESTLPLSAFGTASGTIQTRTHDPLGQWTLSVKDPEGKVDWGEATFRVEEFVPPRHKVDVTFKDKNDASSKATTPSRAPKKSVVGVIQATYYAGGPVKHGKVRWRLSLEGTRHPLPDPKGYVCGTDLPGESELLEAGEAMLGADGTLAVDIPISPEVADGRRSLSISATVLDFDARSASGTGRYSMTPPYLVGLSDHLPQVDAEEPVDLSCVVIDQVTGKPIPQGEVTIEVLQERWTSLQKRNEEGDFYWSWESVMTRAFELTSTIKNGVAPIHVSFADGGKYQVQVGYKAPDGTVYRSTTSFDVQWGDSDGEGNASKWRAERMRTISLRADRLEYVPGETARIRINTPRPAQSYLVTVERDRIFTCRRVIPTASGDPIEIPIPDEYVPNVTVSVLAVHGRQGFPVYAAEADTGAPSYSHGYLTIPVRRVHTSLKISLTGAGESVASEPGRRHQISVTVQDKDGKPTQCELALAVVDESVLALTAYETPQLDELFKVLLPLIVKTGDLRGALALQTPFRALSVLPLSGGDGANGNASRTREWFDPVAFFQPDIVTDAQGKATVEFTLPDNMTTYRVFVVACDKGEQHGSTARPLLVRKPFYIEVGAPRFFTHEDQGRFLVALFNGTGKAGEARLEAQATGGLELKVARTSISIAAGDRAQIPIDVRAVSPIDSKVRVSATLNDKSDAVALTVPVRSRYVTRTQVVDGVMDKSSAKIKLSLPPEAAGLPPDALGLAKARLELSPLPALRLVGGLRFLLKYPYGCIEQTSSAVFPLAALRDLISRGQFPTVSLSEADLYLNPGIERILSMQTASGGFGYWPGYSTPHTWGSAYATLALTVAKESGVTVPEAEFNRALDYLVTVVTGKDEGASATRALACYVLSLNRKLTGSALNLLKLGQGLSRDDALLVLLAAHNMGKTDEVRNKLSELFSDDEEEANKDKKAPTFNPLNFYAPERLQALELLTLLELSPKDKRIGRLAAGLLREMGQDGHWSTTQATAWALRALGRYAAKTPLADKAVQIKASGACVSPSTQIDLGPRDTKGLDLDAAKFFASPSMEIGRPGSSPVFYRLEATYPWRGADVAETTAAVQRSYHRLAGDGPIKVGDLVEVEIELKLARSDHYVALVDPLPAGLVAVNSALKTEEQIPARSEDMDGWSFDQEWVCPFVPSHLESRDDRMVAFRDYNWRGKYRFTYVARAVCEGRFVIPPTKLEPMYRPQDSEFSTSAVLTIEPAGK